MKVQRGNGKIHQGIRRAEGVMARPLCGGNRSSEGYREVRGEVTCSNCLKALAKAAEETTTETETVTEEPKEESANVVSYNGGKVHTMMPGQEEHPYPLCRGGGMNNMLTKFTTTNAPLTCKTCLTYAERRAAKAAESATISEAATADNDTTGENMAETVTKLDVNTDEGKAALDQIDANIERARSLAESDNAEALEELGEETETIISSLSGKGSIKHKKEKREAWKAAATLPERPKGEVKKVHQGDVQEKTWDQYDGTVELVNAAAEKLSEGVKAHLKTSHVAKEVAAVTLEAWLRIPNSSDIPDLMGDMQQSKAASKKILELAGQGFEDTYDNRQALKRLMRSVQDQRSDVRAEWLRSLDGDDEIAQERRALVAKVLEGKPEDEKASEWVANVYGTSTIGQTEKRRLEYQAKKELEAAAQHGGAVEGAEGEGAGEGEGEGAEATTPVDPDEYLTKVVDRVYKDVERTDRDQFLKAAEHASDERKKAERERLERALDGIKAMIAATL